MIHNSPLVPKLYNGRVSWGGHVACAIDDTVFDPIVGKPMKVEVYRKIVFTEPVNVEVVVPAESIEAFIRRGKSK